MVVNTATFIPKLSEMAIKNIYEYINVVIEIVMIKTKYKPVLIFNCLSRCFLFNARIISQSYVLQYSIKLDAIAAIIRDIDLPVPSNTNDKISAGKMANKAGQYINLVKQAIII